MLFHHKQNIVDLFTLKMDAVPMTRTANLSNIFSWALRDKSQLYLLLYAIEKHYKCEEGYNSF